MTDADRKRLLELAERCETEEPSVALEWAIATAIGWEYNPKANYPWLDLEGKRRVLCAYFTRSLDAAVTLVPEGWILLSLSELGSSGMNYAHLGQTVDPCATAEGEGTKNLPLALCAAALRARAALAEPLQLECTR